MSSVVDFAKDILTGGAASQVDAAREAKALTDARFQEGVEALTAATGLAAEDIAQFFPEARGAIEAGRLLAETRFEEGGFKALQAQDIAQEEAQRALAGGFGGARGALTGAQALARGDIGAGTAQAQQALEQGRAAGIDPLTRFAQPGQAAFQQQAALTGALGPAVQQQALQQFQNIEGTFAQETEERAILRNAAATGQLGGGNVLEELGRRAAGRQQQQINQRISQLGQQAQLGFGAAGGISGIQVGTGQNLANLQFGAGQALAGTAERFGFGQAGLGTQEAQLQAQLSRQTGLTRSQLQAQLGAQQAGLSQGASQNIANLLTGQGTNLANINLQQGTGIANLAAQQASQIAPLITARGAAQGEGAVAAGKFLGGLV